MNPKKAKEQIKPTASQLGFSEALVKDATDFYWQELRKALGELRAPNIYVNGMGTYIASGKKLVKIRETYKALLDKAEVDTFKKFADTKQVEGKLLNVEKAFAMIRESIEKRKQVKESRNGKSNTENNIQES